MTKNKDNIRLLLHIGYPKTATTTLQEDIFLKLHEKGEINYLGRTTSSTHTRSGKSSFSGVDWAVKLRRHLVLEEAFDLKVNMLSEEKLNVISDEDLTLNSIFNKAQFQVDKDTFLFPEKLAQIFGENVAITVLLTIRNQSSLIFSGFLQKYRFIYPNLNGMTFAEFLFKENGAINTPYLKLYDFNYLTEKYKSLISPRIRVLIFEDLKNDIPAFASELADALGIETDQVQRLIEGKHRRKRTKQVKHHSVGVGTLTNLGRFIDLLNPNIDLYYELNRRHHMRFSWRIKLERKLFWRTKKILVPEPTEQEVEAIYQYFLESNRQFALSMGLDQAKLERYGYL